MKRVTRIIQVPCAACLGTGKGGLIDSGRVPCATCHGSGNVDRHVVELVPDETDEQAHTMLRNAGSLS